MSVDVGEALRTLRRGGLVAIPTETVYGLAADADQPDAVRRIFKVKGRPLGHPLIVHVASVDAAMSWIERLPDHAATLAAACWPGPLTLLLPRSPRAHDLITGGRDTVGVRVPAHPLTLELLAMMNDGGVTAPSANRFGKVSPTTADHVRIDLGDDVDHVLDGGPSRVGVESTIVDCSGVRAQILRAGAITATEVAELLDDEVETVAIGSSRAPGMMSSHYAPRCAIRLVDSRSTAETLVATTPGARLLDYGADLVAGARSLYADLRAADDDGVVAMIVVLPPPEGIGHALRDRLTKAAAPRPAS